MTDATAPAPLAPTLALVVALALVAVPTVPAAAADPTDGATNPCKPYPKDPTLADKAWCTAKGIGNATRILVDNLYDGNYTTLAGLLHGIQEWQRAVVSCARDAGNSTNCPDIAIRVS